jgi:hypothetical protein
MITTAEHVEEFNRTFDGVIERLPYLKSLGVTCCATVNFGSVSGTGTYQEMIDGQEQIQVNSSNQPATVEVPSN